MQIEERLYNLAMAYWDLQQGNYDIQFNYQELLAFNFTDPDLDEKIDTVIARCREIRASEKSPADPKTEYIFREDIAPVPNNSVISTVTRSIMAGGPDFALKDGGWQGQGDSLEYKVTFVKAGTVTVTIEDCQDQTALVKGFSILTVDVLMGVLGHICYTYCGNKTISPLSQTSTVTARQILKYKGFKSYGIKRWNLIEKIQEEMETLGKLKIDVRGANTQNGLKSYKGSLALMQPVKRDFNPFSDHYVISSWYISPGTWAAYNMSQQQYEFIGKLDHTVIGYDHRQQRGSQSFAKKLMIALFIVPGGMYYIQKGAKKSLADYLKMIGEYREIGDVNRNTRHRALKRLGAAIDFLVAQRMITTNVMGSLSTYIKSHSKPHHMKNVFETIVEIRMADA